MSLQNVNSYTYTPGFTQGQYHNAVICISGNVQSLYLNGNLVGSTSTANNILSYYPNINQILLGCAGDKSNGFTGYLDDFRMYNYAFNSSQVSNLYSNRNLIAYYPFDTSLNTTTANHSTLTYDATLVGGNAVITTSDKTYKVGTGGLSLTNTAGITSTSYVNSTCGFSNTATNNLSISIWFQTSAISGRTMRLIDLCPAVGTPGIFIDISGTNGINTLYNNIPITLPTTNGLIAYFNFDGTIGSTTTKEIISSTNITGTSIIDSNAKFGTGCLDCTGTKFVTGTGLSITISTQLTISFWLKVNQIPNTNFFCYFALLGSYNLFFNNYTNGVWGSSISLGSNNPGVGGSSGLGNFPIFTPTDTTTWNHLSITINGTNWVQYRNGALVSSGTKAGLTLADTYTSITFGNYPGGGQSANCYFDDFRIYNRALSSNEISTIYTATL